MVASLSFHWVHQSHNVIVVIKRCADVKIFGFLLDHLKSTIEQK